MHINKYYKFTSLIISGILQIVKLYVYLDFRSYFNRSFERNNLSIQRLHGCNVFTVLVELHIMNARKQFLEVRLDDYRVGSLTKDLQ